MTAEHDRETRTDKDIRAERDRALAHVAALEALCAEAAPVVRAVHELLVRTVAAEAARDEALAKVAEVQRAIPAILAPIDVLRHSLDCTMRPAIYNGARCSCDLPSQIRRAVQAELHAALAAGSSGVSS